jgi:hypothetical protein
MLELSASSLRLSVRALDGVEHARAEACTGRRVLVIERPDPPTAPPRVSRLACEPADDRDALLSLPLDTIGPRALAIVLAELASAGAQEPLGVRAAEPLAADPLDPRQLAADQREPEQLGREPIDSVPTEPPRAEVREVVVRRTRDWTGRPFLRLGAQGSVEISAVSSPTSVQELMTGGGAGVIGAGITATPWLRPALTLRIGASGHRSFEAQLALAPELLISISEGTLTVAPALLLGWLDGAAVGGGLDIGVEPALGAESALRAWAVIRLTAMALDAQPSAFSIGLGVGVDIAP